MELPLVNPLDKNNLAKPPEGRRCQRSQGNADPQGKLVRLHQAPEGETYVCTDQPERGMGKIEDVHYTKDKRES